MKARLRMTRALYLEIRTDLGRVHPHAAERVGFVFGRKASLEDGAALVLLTAYQSIPDERYLRDRRVAARIDSSAIRAALQRSLDTGEGIFHVHSHLGRGQPMFSSVDERELGRLMPSFSATSPAQLHGALLLSEDGGLAWINTPGGVVTVTRLNAVGFPTALMRGES